ncbi:phage holin family protein [Muricoccus vinaceus]|uniref:Phage holin family protein n=1 Tax=Muricoccus vinaceus TaxID=424704 RepID=A0ABV6IZ64_9PROT
MSDLNRSVPDLLGDLVQQTTTLVRKEVQLARAEMGEKVTKAGAAAGGIAVGGVLLLAALVILLEALVDFLVTLGLSAPVAGLIVAVVVALIGYIMLQSGLKALKASNLTPERTVNQLSRDAAAAKETVR